MNLMTGARWATVMLLLPGSALPGTATEQPMSEQVRTAANDGNAFALDLYARLAADGSKNVFFSPTSISTALTMAYAGARGQTAQEMADALHLSLEGETLHAAVGDLARRIESERPGLQVTMANAMWGQQGYPFNGAYLALGRKHYGAPLRELDFAGATERARVTINDWVESETGGKIKDLFLPGSLDAMTRLVLTNAIYFKGTWMREFDPRETRKAPFHTSGDETVQVEMMHSREGRFRYLETPELQAIELPYTDRAAAMIVLLPAADRSLGSLEDVLSVKNLEAILSEMSFATMDLVALPRFKMTLRYSLPRVLSGLGMGRAFTGAADFGGIASVEDLHISEVVHKAFVEVNEEGTEAAAATGTAIRVTSVEPGYTFRADRPFVFLIRDEATGAILFMGRVVNPT